MEISPTREIEPLVQHRLDWSKLLLYVLLAGAFISALLLTFVADSPANYSLVPAARWVLFGTVVGLLFFWWHWRNEMQSEYRSKLVAFDPLMSVASIIGINACLQLVENSTNSDSLRIAKAYAYVLLVLMAIFALRWRREHSIPYRLLANRWRRAVVGIAAVVIVSLYAYSDIYPGTLFGRGATSGAASPWSPQFLLAQQAAAKIDKDALFERATAWPVGSLFAPVTSANQALEVHFYFVGSVGERLEVSYQDNSPVTTLKTRWDEDPGSVQELRSMLILASERTSTNTQALSAAKYSPRDALAKTLPEVLAIAAQHGLQSSPVIGSDPGSQRPLWNVGYVAAAGSAPAVMEAANGDPAINMPLSFTVDAVTGEIISRDYKDVQATPTPTTP